MIIDADHFLGEYFKKISEPFLKYSLRYSLINIQKNDL